MKFLKVIWTSVHLNVAPLAGAWIEISSKLMYSCPLIFVAPLAGAWIEMPENVEELDLNPVAPLAGAWIEIHCDHGKKFL